MLPGARSEELGRDPDEEVGARGIKLTAPCPSGLVERLELADKPLLPPVCDGVAGSGRLSGGARRTAAADAGSGIDVCNTDTCLFAVNVVISTLLPHAVKISSQLLPPVMRCTAFTETSSLEFLLAFVALPVDGAVLCFVACLCRLSAKNNAKTAFNLASRMSAAVTCSNPWTFCA